MEKKLETLYDLCETVSKELEAANEKINHTGGDLSAGDLEYLDKLTHCYKSIKEAIVMIENEMMEEGYSGYNMGGRSMNRGSSYARGGRGGRSMARGNRYARGNYSRGDSREDFMDEIEELMDKAPDEHTRKKFERLLDEMK